METFKKYTKKDSEFPPVGVNYKDWTRQKAFRVVGTILSAIGVIAFVSMAFSPGPVMKPNFRIINVDELKSYRGQAFDMVGIAGQITSDDRLVMPDTKDRVVAGNVNISITDDSKKQILYRWSGKAKSIRLVSGTLSIPVEIHELMVCLHADQSKEGDILYSNSRDEARPVSMRYAGMKFPIHSADWEDGLNQKIQRNFLLEGESVVLVAGLTAGGHIIEPTQGRMRLEFHPENKIIHQAGFNAGITWWQIMLFTSGLIVYAFGKFWQFRLLKYSQTLHIY